MDDLKYKGYDEFLVETIFGQVKSQGLFDQIRRECLADVDTTPAYQNLRQRVDTEVSKFLSKQEWTPDTNKNQLREKLRKYIIEMNFLDKGVQRIVDQVVNPKSSAFMPKIEDMVYTHVGVEKPKVERLEPPGISELTLECFPPGRSGTATAADDKEEADLLPTDLEAVSPDSERSSDRKSTSSDVKEEDPDKIEIKTEQDEKMDDDVSPPFEPLEVDDRPPLPEALIKSESQESTISGLTSQDSIESDHHVKAEPTPLESVTEPLEDAIKVETTTEASIKAELLEETVKEDTQLSQLSSDTQNSLMVADQRSTSNEEPLKMDISEEAQMPIEFQEPEKSEVLTSFDLNKEAFKFEQVKREEEDSPPVPSSTLQPNDPIPGSSDVSNELAETDSQTSQEEINVVAPPPLPLPTEEQPKPAEPQAALVNNVCPSGEVNKILVKANVAEDTEESLLDSGDSMDLKIVESDSRGSVSNSNHSAADTRESKKPDERSSHSSSHRRSLPDHHRSSSSSGSHQHRSSSHKSSRDRDKERSRRRSRDHHKSSDRKGDRSSSSKKDSEKKGRDKDKSSSKDSSCRSDRNEKQRRSTDRDSNDGAGNNVSSSQRSTGTNGTTTDKSTKTTTTTSSDNQKAISSTTSPQQQARDQGSNKIKDRKKQDSSSSQSPTSTTSTITTATTMIPTTTVAADSSTGSASDRVQKPIVVDQFLDGKELNLQMLACRTPDRDPPRTETNSPSSSTGEVPAVAMPVKKPKIAANFKEALKLSKIRKMMNLQKAKEAERAAVAMNKAYEEQSGAASPDAEDDGEGSLHYFPEPDQGDKFKESATEIWWRQTKEQNANPKLIEDVKRFVDDMMSSCKRLAGTQGKTSEDGPVIKKAKVEEKSSTETKPINGISSLKMANLTGLVDGADDDEDYQEVEVDLDDLPMAENNNVQKEANKNYGLVFNKLVNGDAELELTAAGVVTPKVEEERRNRGPKQPVTQTQRYTSEDLYKPRPVIGRSRRSRALDGETEGSR